MINSTMQSANSTTTTEQKKDIRQQKKNYHAYMKHASGESDKPSKVEYELTHEQENRRERLDDEAYHKIEKYGDIKLIFGKHKGKTLDELKDTQTDYLLWLLDAMENDTKKHSPTQIAIMKYIKHCV